MSLAHPEKFIPETKIRVDKPRRRGGILGLGALAAIGALAYGANELAKSRGMNHFSFGGAETAEPESRTAERYVSPYRSTAQAAQTGEGAGARSTDNSPISEEEWNRRMRVINDIEAREVLVFPPATQSSDLINEEYAGDYGLFADCAAARGQKDEARMDAMNCPRASASRR